MWWRLQHTTFGAAKGHWSDCICCWVGRLTFCACGNAEAQSCELCTAQGMPEGNEKAHNFRTLAKVGLQRGEAEFPLAKQLWFWFCCSFGVATWDTTQKHNSSVWSLAEQEICCRTLMSLSAAVPIRVKTGEPGVTCDAVVCWTLKPVVCKIPLYTLERPTDTDFLWQSGFMLLRLEVSTEDFSTSHIPCRQNITHSKTSASSCTSQSPDGKENIFFYGKRSWPLR